MTEKEEKQDRARRAYVLSLLTQGALGQVAAYDYALHVLEDPFRYRPMGIPEAEYVAEIERLRAEQKPT